MKRATSAQIESIRKEHQQKIDDANQWFLNLKKGMPICVLNEDCNMFNIMFCEHDVVNGELTVSTRTPFNLHFNHDDRVLCNDGGRIWMNGSNGIWAIEATKHLIETVPMILPPNTTPELMQQITVHLNKIFG